MYLVLEGGEATGKSTLALALSKKFEELGHDVLLTKEPGSLEDIVCQEIRSVILDPDHDVSDKAALLLFCADRAQHITKVVKPALDNGKVVISDRSSLSTVVYHIAKLMVDTPEESSITTDYFYEIIDFAQELAPDFCFVANASWDWSQKQLAKRKKLDRIEFFGEQFHKNVHALFSDFASQQLTMLHPLASKAKIHMQTFPKKIYKLPPADSNRTEALVSYIVEVCEKTSAGSGKEKGAVSHVSHGRLLC